LRNRRTCYYSSYAETRFYQITFHMEKKFNPENYVDQNDPIEPSDLNPNTLDGEGPEDVEEM